METAPGSDAVLTPPAGGAPWRLALNAGTCWLDVAGSVEIERPFPAKVAPGSQVEIRTVKPRKSAGFLLRELMAEEDAEAILSVVAGQVMLKGLMVPAGMKAKFIAGAKPILESLTETDLAAIDAWRTRRIEGAATRSLNVQSPFSASPGETRFVPLEVSGRRLAFTTELRQVTGHLLLRTPLGEVALGDLPAWRDGRWHRLTASAGSSLVEVFLDGRRLLRVVPSVTTLPGEPALGVSSGSLEIRGMAAGGEQAW